MKKSNLIQTILDLRYEIDESPDYSDITLVTILPDRKIKGNVKA